ncbi:hypothetical protein OHC33_001578 [Knufia fluminis]|uniref:Uncharacterized protein n=1 Tax=Knufia fluminis TaxID=191047 RepID=A0AAN8ERR2_9EURO|nr:hypothetical protein OHC33_001578 [Knufia fluminis]
MSTRNVELQRLLASLNGTSSANAEASDPPIGAPYAPRINGIPGLGGLLPDELGGQPAQFGGSSSKNSLSHPQHNLLQPSQIEADHSRSTTPSIPIPDASTITTWPAALKHVTKYLSTNEKVMSRIKHLINEQHKHEEQWWAQRQAIVTKHAGRSGNQTKVADILKELGGLAAPIAQVDEAADKNELEAFDRKVYKSMVQMAADFDGQLKKLGVPFYAIKYELVVQDGQKSEDGAIVKNLGKEELRGLQRRMLQHLEDLLSDD